MNQKRSYIPIKLFLSYLVLSALFVGVSWFLYKENRGVSQAESKSALSNSKILRVSSLLSHIYEAESLGRVTIQSNSEDDLGQFIFKTKAIKQEIDALKVLLTTSYQIRLLDSVKLLLSKKTRNIKQLKTIKQRSNEEQTLQQAINDLSKMESSLRKLQLEDFVKKPNQLGAYQLSVLKKYVAYLNDNIPDDSTNTLTKKRSDSIIMVSKSLLFQVRKSALRKQASLNQEENKLLQNELLISDQLRKVLHIIESEIVRNTAKNYLEKESSLKRNNLVVSIAAVLGLFSTLSFLVLILNDFSKSQSYKRQLEQANQTSRKLLRNREQLISTVSHDLKTPLSTIVGCTELLVKSALSQKQLYLANNIKGASQYITKLIQDLLDFTQIEAGKISLERLPFSLSLVITDVVRSIQAVHLQKPIALSIDIDPVFQRKIIGDPFRLRQIVCNIVGNAFKFTEKGYIKVAVKGDLENHLIIIRVEDTGIGIEPKEQQLIFEEFTQANKGIEKRYGGSGLGLTISKKMIEILGGQLSLESVYNQGSVFDIQLPLLFDATLPQAEAPLERVRTALTGIVVDDDVHLLGITTELLRQNNIEVRSFSSALTALEDLQRHPFNFIITDMQMPEMDGFEFLRKIRSCPTIDLSQKPIIALSGRIDLESGLYKNAGFTHWIAKPFESKELLEILLKEDLPCPAELLLGDQKASYSLDSLKLFLGSSEEEVKVFLNSFKSATSENIRELSHAISNKDRKMLRAIAHRMGPMFKQMEAAEVVSILEELEHGQRSMGEIQKQFQALRKSIELFFLLVEA